MPSTQYFDEDDMIEMIMNDRWAHFAAIEQARAVSSDYDEEFDPDTGWDPAESWAACKRAGENIRDYVVRKDAQRRGVSDNENNLTECLFARLLGCVDWSDVGRHYLNEVKEQ